MNLLSFRESKPNPMNPDDRSPQGENKNILSTAVDLTLKIGTLLLIIFLCFRILLPFVSILLWAAIIAIILEPLYSFLGSRFGRRKKLAAVIIAAVFLTILLLPSYWLVDSIIGGLRQLAGSLQNESLDLPPPSETVASWPLIGEWVYSRWMDIHENLSESLAKYLPQLRGFGEKILNSLAGTGLGILQFALSIIIASVLLTYSEEIAVSGGKLFTKLAGERGSEYAAIAQKTVKNVATGVIGVAVIQSFLFGAGMVLSNLPLAGFWILITLIIAIIQVPMMLVTIPLVIWAIATKEPLPAILWSAYFVLVGLVDNVLKPMIMGAGAGVPMLVVFLGALGGFIAYGFLGLFFGAIIVSLGYRLYIAWLEA
jgi:predicted PurR-regulated permease PerM